MNRRLIAFVAVSVLCLAGPLAAGPLGYAVALDDDLSGQFGTLDVGTGAFTPIGTPDPDGYSGIASGPGGLFAMTSFGDVVRIDATTGAVTFVGHTGINEPVQFGILFAGTGGDLFAMDLSNNVYSIDPNTGAATLLGSTGITVNPGSVISGSLAGNDSGLFLTFESSDPNIPSELYSLNTATGAATPIGPIGIDNIGGSGFIGGSLYGVAFDFTTFAEEVIKIDPSTGAGSVVTDTDQIIFGLTDLPVAAPEPSSLLLAGLGVATLAGYRGRRKPFAGR